MFVKITFDESDLSLLRSAFVFYTAKHAGLHTKEYYNKVQTLLEGCKNKEQVINTLKMIATELAEGTF